LGNIDWISAITFWPATSPESLSAISCAGATGRSAVSAETCRRLATSAGIMVRV